MPTGMSHWSVMEPAVTFSGNVDHWTKLRSQAVAGEVPSKNTQMAKLSAKPTKLPPVPGAKYGDGRVDPVANGIAHQVSIRDMHGNIPGNYSSPYRSLSSRSRTSARSRSSDGNCYSARAKEGYKYWYQERPKPTKFGRYGIGSYKTVLGLGSAPRT